jgi:hypothetical protein
MIWYCLDEQPLFRNPHQTVRTKEIERVRGILEYVGGKRDKEYFKNCWLLEEVDGVPIRQFISSVIVPASAVRRVRRLSQSLGCLADVIAAEEFGYQEGAV